MDAKTRIQVLINIVPKGVDRAGVTVRKKNHVTTWPFMNGKKKNTQHNIHLISIK